MTVPARPFIKSAGGKDKVWPQLETLLPETFDRYFEPFAGGAAVFWRMRYRRSSPDERRFTLADLNEPLIAAYMMLQHDVEIVIKHLKTLEAEHSEGQYYAVRDVFNKGGDIDLSEVAAMFIYLNKTGYNGLWRVNSGGHYNVPFGQDTFSVDEENLRACAVALQGVTLLHDPYENVVSLAKAGDLVYMDPPYYPLTDDSFTAYTKEPFGPSEHEMLGEVCRILDQHGVTFMLSNIDHPEVRRIWQGFDFEVVQAARAISSKGTGRGAVNEVVIRNY